VDQRGPINVLPDRRRHPRFPVEARARLFLPVLGSELQGTLIELSLNGCRLRTDREYYGGVETRIELCFAMRAMSFRLSGVTQSTAGKTEVGIRFVGMNARREAELGELLAEIAADLKAGSEKDARDGAAAEQAVAAARAEVERLELELAENAQAEEAARRAAEATTQHRLRVWHLLENARAARDSAERLCSDLAVREAARREALAGCEATDSECIPECSPAAEMREPADSSPAIRAVQPAALTEDDAPHVPPESSCLEAPANAPAHHQGNTAAQHSHRDRRQETRHSIDTRATIFLLDVRSQITARILDISPSGCRMRCAEKFPVGIYRRVEVEFVLDGLPFRLPGVVQSMHDRFTTGIRFIDVSARRKEQLLQVIDEISEMKEKCAEPHPAGATD
jgi:hypothetical protein